VKGTSYSTQSESERTYTLAGSAYFYAIDKDDKAGLAKEDNQMNYLQILPENL